MEIVDEAQGDYDGSAKQTASPVFTAIMSGRVRISGRVVESCIASCHKLNTRAVYEPLCIELSSVNP